MKQVLPHEFFRLDFDQILEEGKRQEEINKGNVGEYELVKKMHSYFDNEVLPLIQSNDWIFEAAQRFVSEYAMECFTFLRLSGKEVFNTQKNLLKTNERTIDFLARAHLSGAAPLAGTIDLPKASDFLTLVKRDKLSPAMYSEAMTLYEDTKDHELLQLQVTLRGIRGCYETPLPRIMFVVRRAIKVRLGLPPKESDNELKGISEYINWYIAHIDSNHPLNPIFGELQNFYKIARNVGSHHRGLKWESEKNQIVLEDDKEVLPVHLHKFQRKYRHLVYLCELGLRGILSAFCQREQGILSEMLVRNYAKTFPEDFPEGESGIVRFYSK